MAGSFGTDVLNQAQDPKNATLFYVEHLRFGTPDEKPNLISLHGKHIKLLLERGTALGAVQEATSLRICNSAEPANLSYK